MVRRLEKMSSIKELVLEKRYFANDDEWEYMLSQVVDFDTSQELAEKYDEVSVTVTIHTAKNKGIVIELKV